MKKKKKVLCANFDTKGKKTLCQIGITNWNFRNFAYFLKKLDEIVLESYQSFKTEEITLSPTPQLKRIYTPPLIKVLFPPNQCKSSFHKFTTKSIETYTSQYNKNMIHNHTLTEDEFLVLNKDLSFVSSPTKIFKQEINRSWNKFKTRMLKQYFFRNNIDYKPTPFKRKSNWIPPRSDNPTLVDFFTRIEQEVTSINTPFQKTHSNLTLRKKATLSHLKNKQSIAIKPCDKGGSICIMNTRDYLTKIHTHLQDRNTYKPLTHNATSAIANDVCTHMYFQPIIDKATMEFLLPPSLLWTTQNSQARLLSPPCSF